MAINNFFCEKCQHEIVCKVRDVIMKFHEDAKNQLGVDVTLDSCRSFDLEEVDE